MYTGSWEAGVPCRIFTKVAKFSVENKRLPMKTALDDRWKHLPCQEHF